MKTRQVIQLVAGREIRDRLRNRAFMIGTGLTLVVLVALIVAPTFFDDGEPPSYDLGVVGEADPLLADAATSAAQAREAEVQLAPVEDEAAAEAAVQDGDVDAVLLDQDRLLVADDPDENLQAIVDQARQQAAMLSGLEEAGVDPAEASELLAGPGPVEVVTPDGSVGEAETGQAIAFVATILLFLIVQLNGSTMLTGAIEEKASRVVEVLLGSIRPWQLLAGKLSGLTLLALGQLALFVGAGLGANAVVDAFEVPPATTTAVAVSVLMLVLGFAFYASLYAVAGSMASSLEDAQASAGPLGFLTATAYAGTLIGVIPNPESIFAQVLTYFPPTAPFAVPARITVGSISTIEIAIAAVLTAVAAVATVRLAGRLYSAAILAGGKLTWREVVRAEPV